jgi:hypothetical protein
MKRLIPLVLLAMSAPLHAETPLRFLHAFSTEAARQQPGFVPSAPRGQAFFANRFGVSKRIPNCVACHTESPAGPGRHAVTGKAIQPLSPRANASRFTDAPKVEKWFRRNCNEVVGRPCSAAEKADVLKYLIERS